MAAPMSDARKSYVAAVVSRRRAAAAAVCQELFEEQHKKKRERSWKKPWLYKHDQQGAYMNLLKELEATDVPSFTNYLRMGPELFRLLLEKVTPRIARMDTNFRNSIPAEERLAVTLRFLATGMFISKKNFAHKMRTDDVTSCNYVL